MNEKNKSDEYKDSAVLSDPHKGKETEAKKKGKGKAVLITIVAFIFAFVLVPYSVVKISNAAKKRNSEPSPFSSRLAATDAEQLGERLFAAKTQYIGDNAACLSILDILDFKSELGDYTISLKTDESPYRLTLEFKNSHDTSRDEWFDLTVIKYSCVLLSLIENADEIAWTCPKSDAREAVEGKFTREDAAKLLNNTPALRYSETKEGVQLLLNELGIGD